MADSNPFAKYRQQAPQPRPVAPPIRPPVQSGPRPGNFLQALASGLNEWLPFEVGNRLGAAIAPAFGRGTDATYQQRLDAIRAQDAANEAEHPLAYTIGGIGGLFGGGGALAKGAGAVSEALSTAPGVAGKVGQVIQAATKLQKGQKLANTARLAGGGAAYAGTEAALDQKSPADIAKSAAIGAAAGPLAVGGLKVAGYLGRNAAEILGLRGAGSILKGLTSATKEDIQKAYDTYKQRTGAEPTLYELLPKSDRENIAQKVFGSSGPAQDTTNAAIRQRVTNTTPEMQAVVQKAAGPGRQRILAQMQQDLAASRGATPADLTPEETALTQAATQSPADLVALRRARNANIMAPVKEQVVVPDVESLYPKAPIRTQQGDIVEAESDPEASAAIRNAAGSLRLRPTPDEDAQTLGLPAAVGSVPEGLTANDLANITKNLTNAINRRDANSGAAERALAHVQGIISDQAPDVSTALEAMRASNAAGHLASEGMAEGVKSRLREEIPAQSTREQQNIINAYDTPQGQAGRFLGQANTTERAFSGTPQEAVRAVQNLAESSATQAPLASNLGAQPASDIVNAAQAQAQSIRNLASASSDIAKKAEKEPDVGDIGSAILAASPGAMVHTRIFALNRLRQLTNLGEKKANFLIDKILSQDPDKTQQGLNMLDNLGAQGKRFKQELFTAVNAGRTAQPETNPNPQTPPQPDLTPIPSIQNQPGEENPFAKYKQPTDYRLDLSGTSPEFQDLVNRKDQIESGNRQFDAAGNTVVSPAGAVGIAQVMPATAPQAAKEAGLPYDENALRTDANYNKALGAAHLQGLLKTFNGNPALALAAYNAGAGAVKNAVAKGQSNWLAYLPQETQDYVQKALAP